MYAVILAGGSGERFWPLSRSNKPKQFLALLGNRSMLQLSFDRLQGLIEQQNIYVVTEEKYQELIREQLPELPGRNIICEYCSRDTAAAAGLAAINIKSLDPEAVMLVLPADHFIADPEEFRKTVKAAAITASTGEWVITFGSKPSRPETGYGYIQPGELFEICDGVKFYKVNSFHEKPDFNTAVNYLMEGNYLWNSGIFMWRIDLILALIKKYLPELSRGLDIIADSYQFDYEVKAIKDIYEKLPRVSIDYGIMEKCRQVLAIPADFGWDDIGSWEVLSRYLDADSKGNVLVGKGVLVDTENCLIYAPHKLIATLGVEDLLIAECGDNLLICKKNKSQQIKEVVKALKEAGFENKI